jgi:hypothetical protein
MKNHWQGKQWRQFRSERKERKINLETRWDRELGKRMYGIANERGHHVMGATMTGKKCATAQILKSNKEGKFWNRKGVFNLIREGRAHSSWQVDITTDDCWLPRSWRMAVMFRMKAIGRSDHKKQRVTDTGFWIAGFDGKTYGRVSKPIKMTRHVINEVMLLRRKTDPRGFAELWPNLFQRRMTWVLIDEGVPRLLRNR